MRITCRSVSSLVLLVLLTASSLFSQTIRFDARSARDGKWSDPATWENGRSPHANDTVQIRPNHIVVYDIRSSEAIRILHVAGALRFSREHDTQLDVGLLKIQPGEFVADDGSTCDVPGHDTSAAGAADAAPAALEIGTADQPIPAGIKATIRLVYFPGANAENEPAIINCGGRWDLHGTPMDRTWIKLDRAVKPGDESVTVQQPPVGWNAGDRLIVTSSDHLEYPGHPRRMSEAPELYGTEECTITRIDGATIHLDHKLDKAHLADDIARAEVANLSRNVVIESADPAGVRGHTMYHRRSSGSISYAEFRHLGKAGMLGRYPVHFHLVRDTLRGSGVIGASIWDSNNRFMAIHGTDYLLIRDCVGYQCLGHGFFLEDATEQYNVLDRNLAVQAFHARRLPHQALDFDDNEGAGFWWANGRNTLTRNVACENFQYGFRFQMEGSRQGRESFKSLRLPDGTSAETDVRTVPFFRFEENESHSSGLYDFDFGDDPDGSVHGDAAHPFIVRNLKSWMSHYALRPNISYFLTDGFSAFNDVYGVYHPTYNQQVFRSIQVRQVDAEPINRGHDDESYQNGSFTYDGLTLENCRTGRDPIIQLSCTSDKPGQSGHFRNVKVVNCQSPSNIVDLGGGPRNDKLEYGVAYYFHGWPTPGQTLEVASITFPALLEGGGHSLPTVTGPDVRAIEMPELLFPELLHPIDDLPPATLITSVRRTGKTLLVRGISEDNDQVVSVQVNGAPAHILTNHAGLAEWEIQMDAAGVREITAASADRAGNVEKTGARTAVNGQ